MKKEFALNEIITELDVVIPQYKVCSLINTYFEVSKIEKKIYQNSDKDLIDAFDNSLESYLLCASDIDREDKFVVMEGAMGKSVYDWNEAVNEQELAEYIYSHWNDFEHYFSFDINDTDYDEE